MSTLVNSLHHRPLPLPLRVLNGTAKLLRNAGLVNPRFDADALLGGQPPPIDDIPGLRSLTGSLTQQARLSGFGHLLVGRELRGLLQRRRQLDAFHAEHPAIGQQPVAKPIILIGQARAGTTFMHELLALDPQLRAPRTWELEMPFPPRPDAAQRSRRAAKMQSQLEQLQRLQPAFGRMHRMGASLPQECVRMTGLDFNALVFFAMWRVPAYLEGYLREANARKAALKVHRQMLQFLQWGSTPRPWLLKSPEHLLHLDALLDVYPDARLIQTHRDPLAVTASISSFCVALRRIWSSDVDVAEIGQQWADVIDLSNARASATRSERAVESQQIIDVHIADIVRDPLAVVSKIYDHFDIELRPDVAEKMRQYAKANPKDRDGKHRHDFRNFGLDYEERRAKARPYQERFAVPNEVSPAGGRKASTRFGL